MITISETPILLAHWHWRCAERKLYTGLKADAMVELNTVIRELEKAMQISQDSRAKSCIQKQIEFHQRRVNLLSAYYPTAETEGDDLLSEEGTTFSQGNNLSVFFLFTIVK